LSESIHVPSSSQTPTSRKLPKTGRKRGWEGRTVAGDNEPLDGPRLPLPRRAHHGPARRAHRRLAVLVAREPVGGDPAQLAGAQVARAQVAGAAAGHFVVVAMMTIRV
jgi:hypothetical protein